MKNSRKLAKSELKKINGGNAPECPPETMACYVVPANGGPGRWRCIPTYMECP